MSSVLATEAEVGKWYQTLSSKKLLRCVGEWPTGTKLFLAVNSVGRMNLSRMDLSHLKPLPECTGWDYEPPPWTSATAETPQWTPCRFRDREDQEWSVGLFLARIFDRRLEFPFICGTDQIDISTFALYKFCEIEITKS